MNDARTADEPDPTEHHVEIEREHTKQQLISSVTQLLVVILYMAFTMLRDRDHGVIVLDPEGEPTGGPEDDWAEA